MAEITLAVLCIVAGLLCAALALLSAGANHIGGATNPSMIDHKPTVIFAVLALAGIGGGISILVF